MHIHTYQSTYLCNSASALLQGGCPPAKQSPPKLCFIQILSSDCYSLKQLRRTELGTVSLRRKCSANPYPWRRSDDCAVRSKGNVERESHQAPRSHRNFLSCLNVRRRRHQRIHNIRSNTDTIIEIWDEICKSWFVHILVWAIWTEKKIRNFEETNYQPQSTSIACYSQADESDQSVKSIE
jgi:hypothetical protein